MRADDSHSAGDESCGGCGRDDSERGSERKKRQGKSDGRMEREFGKSHGSLLEWASGLGRR